MNISVTPQKRGRGRTRLAWMARMPVDEKIPIILNTRGQPIGINAKTLAAYIGVQVKNGRILPLDKTNWIKIDTIYKDSLWQKIQERFDIPIARRDFVMKSANHKWREFKAELKEKYYTRFSTRIERLMNKPIEVEVSQWPILIDYWDSEKSKAISIKNKASRAKQAMLHTFGQKSFARVEYEEQRKDPDMVTDRAWLFIKTHKHKDGTAVDAAAVEAIEKMEELISQTQERSQDKDGRGDVYARVMGRERPGRIRGYGMGPTPTSIWGSTSCLSCGEAEQLREIISTKDKEMANVHKELDDLRGRLSIMEHLLMSNVMS